MSLPIRRVLPTKEKVSRRNRIRRAIWNTSWALLGSTSPTALHSWRCCLARIFGATIKHGVHIYPHVKIWAPWNLMMENRSCLANGVGCYNVAPITIGEDVVISQDVYLCTATHDYNDPSFALMVAPIEIHAHAWVAAGAFVSPGITIERGAVVGARSVVTACVPEWTVVAGNPARAINTRRNLDGLPQ